MPSKSKKQHNLMAAVANNPAFAKKVGISKSIGEEFMKADKTKKFKNGDLVEVDSDKNPGLSKLPTEVRNKMGYMKKGGMAMKKGMHKMADGKMMKDSDMPKKKMNMGGMADMAQDKKTVKKAVGMHEKQLHGGKKSDLAKLKSGGMAKCARGGGIEVRGKTKGKMC
jgi:RNA polymerase-binding transcription factor DksA